MSDERSSFETVIRWVVIVILAVVALKVALTILGIAIGLVFGVGGLLWKLLPFVLLVWLVFKGVEWLREKNGDTPATYSDTSTIDADETI